MSSRSRLVAKAFGKSGVLSKATLDVPKSVGGVEPVANEAALGSGIAGDLKFATATKAAYLYDGTEWDRISTGNNETPRLTTTPASTLKLEADGSTSTLTMAAEDPEGFPITYSSDTSPASPNQITGLTNSGGTFTFTPSTNSAHTGSFTARLKASDGISTTAHAVAVSLAFSPAPAFQSIYIAHTSGTVRTVTGGADEANATSLDSVITSTANNGDLILLNPAAGSTFGHFKTTHSVGDASHATPFANKQIAIVGGGLKPNNIFLWDNHDGSAGRRDHPIFCNTGSGATSYRAFLFNLTYHRHQTSTTNYENALSRNPIGGGTALNCIIDLNGGRGVWIYDNSSVTSPVRSFKHCSFVNYTQWDANYNGNAASCRVIDCAFEQNSNRLSTITDLGTNQEGVSFDDWEYDTYTTKNVEITSAIANGTYGHLKDLQNVTGSNTLFNSFQSAN